MSRWCRHKLRVTSKAIHCTGSENHESGALPQNHPQKAGDARYEHSLCVAEAAAALARKYGADPQKAELAGTLHDIMKDTPAPSSCNCSNGLV